MALKPLAAVRAGEADLEEVVVEAWLARAPARLVEAYLEKRR